MSFRVFGEDLRSFLLNESHGGHGDRLSADLDADFRGVQDVGRGRCIQSLDRSGPCIVGELGDDLGVVPSTASRLSDRLAEAGLITRWPALANRRSTLLELTDAGREILAELVSIRIRQLDAVAERMS